MPTPLKNTFGEDIATSARGGSIVPTALPVPALPSTINSKNIAPSTPIPYNTPAPTPTFPVSGLDATSPLPALQMTQPEKQAQDLSTRIQGLNDMLTGESAYRIEQQNAQGIPEQAKTYNDLSARLKTLQNEALAIPLQLQQEATGRGITAAGLQPIEAARTRVNAIASLGVASTLEATRGNLSLAYDLADRAVAQKYDPVKAQIDAAKSNLDIILKSPEYTLAEKNRAQAQLEVQNAKAKVVAKQEADSKEIYNIGLTALKYGADALTVQKIQNAKTPQEAIQLGAKYLVDPQAKYELESARLDTVLKRQQIEKTNKEIAAIGQPSASDIKAQNEAISTAKAQLPVAQGKLNLINSLIASPGLASAVGPNPLSRISTFEQFNNKRGDFIAGVNQLVSQETLNALLSLKAQGGTLGALNESEGAMLRQSATKINSWAIPDPKNPNVIIGYDTTEAAFQEELKTIQRLSQLAVEKAQGTLISKDEDSALTAFFSQPSLSTGATAFDPASFYIKQ